MRWECARGCAASGAKEYATEAEARRYATAFDREDSRSLGRRPTLSTLPLLLSRSRRYPESGRDGPGRSAD